MAREMKATLEQNTTDDVPNSLSPVIAVLCILFLVANLTVPFTLGDVYPFTVAPMFRDTPQRYENYRVYFTNGEKLADNSTRRVDDLHSPDPFLLRRYYDGNPVGFGVGIRPPQTLDCFGEMKSEKQIRQHVVKRLRALNIVGNAVVVEREIIGVVDEQRVGVVTSERWTVWFNDEFEGDLHE